MDHPGFEIVRRLSPTRGLARFQGGVPDDYFHRGIPLRLMPGGAPAKLGRGRKGRTFEIQFASDSKVRFAVWELEDFAVRQQRIYGRSCDDLIGVAAILATMIELKHTRAGVNVIGVISRAEEIGFQGALACAASGELPSDSLVISLETSRELPGVKMGAGVILRVGDRTSIFNPEATRFLTEVSSGLTKKRSAFRFQRALMAGGTCEATAYQELGFQTAGVCIALGNYHNCAARKRIAAEYVSIPDTRAMVDLLIEAARQMPKYSQLVGKLPKRLNQMLRQAQKKLRATADA
jgi:hypothetical protein